jgi:hypothetical protein
MAFDVSHVTNTTYQCLSTDVKLTEGVKIGAPLFETDTGIHYLFDGSEWIVKKVANTIAEVEDSDRHLDTLQAILLEMQIMNTHLTILTDNEIKEVDILGD